MSEVGALLEALTGDDEWTRHTTLERLRAGGARADTTRGLLDALDDGRDATRRSAARMALAALASPESPTHDHAQTLLRDSLSARSADLRVLAAAALGEAGDPGAADSLIHALDDAQPNVAAAAADALGQLRPAKALDPLAEKAGSGVFWVRVAAVVALGSLGDERAVPALSRAGTEPGLAEPVIEALRRIKTPAVLPALEALCQRAPGPALLAAGAVLAAHPDAEPPAWVRPAARSAEALLLERFTGEDDPAAARLLGLSATPAAVTALVSRVGPPRWSEAAIAGILALPPATRAPAILARLADAEQERALLLSLLPPLGDDEQIRELLPLLGDPDPAVRVGAAEALARSPADRILPLLASELERTPSAPYAVRAMGGLGGIACGALVPLLEDDDAEVRRAAAEALGRCATSDVTDPIAAALSAEPSSAARQALLRALGRAGGGAAVQRLAPALDDPDPGVRLATIDALGATGSGSALPHLRRALEAPPAEQAAALRAMGELGVPAAAPHLETFLRAEDRELRRLAARGAIEVAGHLSEEAVTAMAGDVDEWVRICAVRVLARRRSHQRLGTMADDDPAPAVRAEARRLLDRAE